MMSWSCSSDGEKRNQYRILVGKPIGNRLFGKLTRWNIHFKVYLREISWEDGGWMELT
jgi:hypothetical protein